MSDWEAGEYEPEAITAFDEDIHDDAADFEAGDYRFVYNVTVEEQRKEGVEDAFF